MKARLLRDMLGSDGKEQTPTGTRHKIVRRPAGTIIDHPDAYHLVRQGCAEAADEECAAAVGMTPAQLAEARVHYDMVAKGIAPEDYAAYQAGAMTGYDPEGNWIPGPRFDEWLAEHEPAELVEEDDDQADAPAAN